MTAPRPAPDPRQLPKTYPPLLIGSLSFAAIVGYLLWAIGPVGQQPIFPLVPLVLALVGLGCLGFALTWGKGEVPTLPPGVAREEYWAKTLNANRALIFWVLVESGIIICLTGTLISGSPYTTCVAALGILVLAIHRPGYFADR